MCIISDMARLLPRALLGILGLSVALLIGSAHGAELPRKVVIAGVQGTTDAWAADVILREAYRRIGVDLEIRKVPALRAIELTKVGQLDGEVQRIDSFKNAYPTLLQVRPAINFLEASAFSGSVDFEPQGWESLRPYTVGVVRGIKFAVDNTSGMRRYVASDYEPLFRMLDLGRLEIGVVPRINGLWHQAWMKSDRIREVKPPLARFELFHYLHKKHASWIPILAAELSAMQREGRLAVIRQHVHTVLINLARSRSPICADDYRCFEEALPR
jgi:polar amino acid transport system substrate-binding protein